MKRFRVQGSGFKVEANDWSAYKLPSLQTVVDYEL
jgi:hypothetical protein